MYWTPFFSFINCSEITDENELHIYEHNFTHYYKPQEKLRPIPHLSLQFEGLLTEKIELDDYPFDRQFLNIQMHFPKRSQQKYKIVEAKQAGNWFKVLRHSRNIPLTVHKNYNLTDYRIVRNKRENINNLGANYNEYYDYELCFNEDRITNMKIICVRVTRNPSADFVRYVFAILMVNYY